MKRHLTFVWMATAILCVGCERLDTSLPEQAEASSVNNKKAVTFSMNADGLSISKAGTRATAADAGLTDILVIDRMAGNIVQTTTQVSTDEDFGSPTLTLDYGTHELTFIAHRNISPAFDATAFSWTADKVRQTYMCRQQLTVNTETAGQSVSLSNYVYQLKFMVEDALPTGLTTVRIGVTDYRPTLALADFTGIGTTTLQRDITIPANYIGTSGNEFSVFGFCPTLNTEYSTSVSISFLRSDETVIQAHNLNNVPLETNCITTVEGNFFRKEGGFTLNINTAWGTEKTVNL